MNSRRFAGIALLASVLVPLVRFPNSAASEISAQPFDRQLRQAADKLDAAAAYARRHPHGKLSVPNLQLPPAPLGEAPTYSPSLDQWLRSGLAQIRTEKQKKMQAQELLELAGSLRRAAQSNGAATVPRLDPTAQAAMILAQHAYQAESAGPAPAPPQTLWDRFVRWLDRLLYRLFGSIFRAAESKPVVGQIIAVFLILLLVGAASYGVYLLASSFARRRRSAAPDEGSALERRVDPEDLYQLGAAAAADGRYAQAIALLFQASLASFDRHGLLAYDASRTAGEYRRAVRRAIAAASPYFDAIAQAFVLAAFAQRRTSPEDWSAADAAFRSLRPLLAS